MKFKIKMLLTSAALLVTSAAGYFTTKANTSGDGIPMDPSAFYAVLLSNGQMYFGQIRGDSKTEFVKLENVHYVVGKKNEIAPEAADAALIRRGGKEWHQPAWVLARREHIVQIEPVGRESRVMQLIDARAPGTDKQ